MEFKYYSMRFSSTIVGYDIYSIVTGDVACSIPMALNNAIDFTKVLLQAMNNAYITGYSDAQADQ